MTLLEIITACFHKVKSKFCQQIFFEYILKVKMQNYLANLCIRRIPNCMLLLRDYHYYHNNMSQERASFSLHHAQFAANWNEK